MVICIFFLPSPFSISLSLIHSLCPFSLYFFSFSLPPTLYFFLFFSLSFLSREICEWKTKEQASSDPSFQRLCLVFATINTPRVS